MRDVDIVVLSRFPEIFEGFRECVEKETGSGGIVVLDNPAPPLACGNWQQWFVVNVHRPFQMAHNGNIGLRYSDPQKGVLYCGDDVRFIEPDTIKRLQYLAAKYPKVGILSTSIKGTCASEENIEAIHDPAISYLNFVGFVCVCIKRAVIEKVGYLDERFEGYGSEDIDFCYRVRKAGFLIGMARDVTVRHGVNGNTYGSTFVKTRGLEQMGKDDQENRRRFCEKWGIKNDGATMMEFIRKAGA